MPTAEVNDSGTVQVRSDRPTRHRDELHPGIIAARRRENLWALFFIGPQLIGLLAFVLGPLIFALALSLMRWDGFETGTFVGFANFAQQLGDETFRASFWNTVYFTLIAVPGELVCALLVALALNHARGKIVYRLLFFMPVVTARSRSPSSGCGC